VFLCALGSPRFGLYELAAVADSSTLHTSQAEESRKRDVSIGEICTRQIQIVNPNEPLLQAVREMHAPQTA
jgi:hypothetical protein